MKQIVPIPTYESFKKTIKESGAENDFSVDISIEEIDNDERNKKRNDSYDVTYSVSYADGNLLEISGELKSYHTGRSKEFKFEPSWFNSDEAEQHYDENWEDIESEVLEKFENHKKSTKESVSSDTERLKKFFGAGKDKTGWNKEFEKEFKDLIDSPYTMDALSKSKTQDQFLKNMKNMVKEGKLPLPNKQ